MFGKVALNTTTQAAGKIVVLTLSLLTTSLLTRFLGTEGYGGYVFVTALVLLFGSISDWGTNIIAVREASQNKKEQLLIFGNITLFRFLLAVVTVILVNALIRVRPEWNEFVVPTTIGSLVLLALSIKTSFGAVFQTLLRFDYTVIVEIVSSLVFLALVWYVFISNGDLNRVVLSWFLATLIAAMLSFIFVRRLTRLSWKLNKRVILKIFWEAAPAGALFLFFNLYNRVDTVILQYFQDDTAVGFYGLAYKIHDNLVLGAAFLMNSMFPLVSASFAQKGKTAQLHNYYQRSFDLLLGGAIVIFGVFYILAPVIIYILGGESFVEATTPFRILLFATAIAYFNHLTGYSLIAFGKQRVSMMIALGALVFNIVLNFIFVPIYSYNAAALITVATEGLVLLLSTLAIKKTTGIFPSLFSFPSTWVSLLQRKQIF